MKRKDKAHNVIEKFGKKVLAKAFESALNGNSQMMKYILDRFLERKITLQGKRTSELFQSLIKEASKPGVTEKEINNALTIIKVHADIVEMEEIERRLNKLERKTK